MEPTDNNPKTILSVRICAREKQKLVEEAEKLGTTLSEHAERILLNAKSIRIEDDFERLRKENALLVQRLQSVESPPSILNNLTLLNLFEQLKGLNDEIITPDGQKLRITYNSPIDLITAMIHSFKLKR
jgi:predicted nuclease with TOPRIM domain